MRHSRRDTVLDATKRWRDELLDTTGRNPLRNYRDLKVGTLDLTPGAAYSADAQTLDRMLAGRPTRLSDLFPGRSSASEGFEPARRRLVAIHRKTLANLEEKGISTLFAAIGLVTWKVDQGSKPNAPMILLPLEAAPADATATDFKIEVAGDAYLNPVLAHILRTENGIETEEDTEETLSKSLAGFHEQLERLGKSWNALPELTVSTRVVAGNFSYATMPLVKDGCHAGLLLSPETAQALDDRTIEPFLREVKEWTDLGGHELAKDHPVWARSSIDTRESAREALDLARELDASRLPAARASVIDAITELQLATPETAAAWKRLADLLMSVAGLLERHTADVYHLDHTDLIAKLAPAKRSAWSRGWARLLSRRYRAGRRAAQQTLAHTGVELPAAAALDAMEAAYRHAEEWKRLGGKAEPRTPGNLQDLRATVDSLEARLNLLHDVAGIEHLAEMPHQALAATLRKLVSDHAVVARLPRIRQLEARFRNAQTMPVLERVGKSIPPKYASEAVEYAWLRRILEDVDSTTGGFTPLTELRILGTVTISSRMTVGTCRRLPSGYSACWRSQSSRPWTPMARRQRSSDERRPKADATSPFGGCSRRRRTSSPRSCPAGRCRPSWCRKWSRLTRNCSMSCCSTRRRKFLPRRRWGVWPGRAKR